MCVCWLQSSVANIREMKHLLTYHHTEKKRKPCLILHRKIQQPLTVSKHKDAQQETSNFDDFDFDSGMFSQIHFNSVKRTGSHHK